MKTIQLTQGMESIVDDDDFIRVNGFCWQFNGRYAARKENGKTILMHRFIIGACKNCVIDHINGDCLDNRKENLRIVNAAGNAQNAARKPSASGFMGVFKEGKGFKAYITVNTKRKHIGTFATALEAAKAYDREVIKLHGPDALTNKKIIKKAFDL